MFESSKNLSNITSPPALSRVLMVIGVDSGAAFFYFYGSSGFSAAACTFLGGVSVAVDPAAFCSVSGVLFVVFSFFSGSSILSCFFYSEGSSFFFYLLFFSEDLSDFYDDLLDFSDLSDF